MTKLEYRHRKPELNEAGFTLLEIIAVLVILSILAVVAVPRYFDLQTQARDRAVETGVAEGMARVNGYFAQQILSGITPRQIDYTDATLLTDLGDFTLAVTGGESTSTTSNFSIRVIGKTGTAVSGASRTATVKRPGSP